MRVNYPAAILANFGGDYRAAYEYLSKAYEALDKQFSDVWSSRFFEVSRFEADSEICLRQITEEAISRSVGSMREFSRDSGKTIHHVVLSVRESFLPELLSCCGAIEKRLGVPEPKAGCLAVLMTPTGIPEAKPRIRWTKDCGWDLTTIPEAVFFSEVQRRRGVKGGGPRPGSGRPRTKAPRCPCGAMTAKRAKARAHKC